MRKTKIKQGLKRKVARVVKSKMLKLNQWKWSLRLQSPQRKGNYGQKGCKLEFKIRTALLGITRMARNMFEN